jgi:hypothetical protein
MVFQPSRLSRRPPGTDQVLNWAAYGLWEESKKQEKHLLSEEEELDKKKLKAEYQRQYHAAPANKAKKRKRENADYARAPDTNTGNAAFLAYLTTK